MRCTIKKILAGTLLLLCILLAASPSGQASEKQSIAIGYSMQMYVNIDVKDAASAMDIWTRELCLKAGLNGTSTLYGNDRELGTAFQQGKVDIATFSALGYIQMEPALKGSPAFTGSRKGKSTVRYLLIGRMDAPVDRLAQLKGRTLALGREDPMAQLFVNTLLLREGLPESNLFFSAIQGKAKPSQAIHAVYFGSADLCVVTEWAYLSMLEMNPQISHKIKLISTSPELMLGFAIYRHDLAEVIQVKAKDYVKNIKSTPRGRQVLALFQVDDLALVQDSDLAATRELYQEYRKLKSKRK